MISKSKLFPKGHWCYFLLQSSISIWWLSIWQAWCGEGCWLWCPPCIEYYWWLSLPVLWALQVRKVGGPLSQLCRHHSALQMTVTWVWDILLWYLSQKLYLSSQILFYTKNVFIYVCLYLFVPFVILPILLILVYVCTLLNFMVAQKQQFL